ncbi:ATP-binding cassette domain-containing protein [Ornithinicoccus halotolerans]|uniref:ATP-binding cassette domain-containing protein n=1 Tax=Ornithinicoccus halotolerans TaxID=1748220 RepID=UPI001295B31A|nr:ATP-binding cassette domain-containing protein [Ornithinicoccus halotolerans]
MIEARQLTKTYGRTRAVTDLSFAVSPGRVTGFLGPNGAGKSTTMRLIMGLDRPTDGQVTIGGQALRDYPRPLRVVGALLDPGAMHSSRSAYHHLLALGLTNAIPRQRVEEVLAMVGLTDVARRRVRTYSLGMRQRAGIAAALLGDPEVILLDEPVNGLDLDGIRWMRGLLRRLAGEGRTVFVSSHLMSEMELIADHLVVLGKGRLLADVPIEVMHGGSGPRVVVHSPHAAALREVLARDQAAVTMTGANELSVVGVPGFQIAKVALDHGFLVEELRTAETSLEDAYLSLTQGDVEYPVGGTEPRQREGTQ